MNIELGHDWTVVTDPKTGATHLQCLVEEGEQEWIHVLLQSPGRGKYEGTNSTTTAVVIKNSEREEEVATKFQLVTQEAVSLWNRESMKRVTTLVSLLTKILFRMLMTWRKRKGLYKLTHYPGKGEKDE